MRYLNRASEIEPDLEYLKEQNIDAWLSGLKALGKTEQRIEYLRAHD